MAADSMLTERLETHCIRVGSVGRDGPGVIAAVDEDHTIVIGYAPKIIRLLDGSLFGLSGDAECQHIINVLNDSTIPQDQIALALGQVKSESNSLLVRPDGQMVWISTNGEGWGEYSPFTDKFAAVGTGRQFAYGAMEADASAEKAVEIACRRTCYSGPPITVVRLHE